MRLRSFVPQYETDEIQVNQKDLCLDANAVENSESFNEKLSSAPDDTSDDKIEKETTEINTGNETTSLSGVYHPEDVSRRTAIKRDTPVGRQRQTLA